MIEKGFKKFIAQLVILSVVLLTAALLYMIFSGRNDLRSEIFTAFVINFLNVWGGAMYLVKNSALEPKKFVNKVMLSMVVRIFVNLGLIFVCLQFFKFERFVFVIAFFIFYILFLILELMFITSSFKANPENKV